MAGRVSWREIRQAKGSGSPDSPEHIAVRDAIRDAIALSHTVALSQLRGELGLTQAAVAEVLKTSQASVSKLERREDLYLSTLREYIEALGGSLEITAVFPEGERIGIRTERERQAIAS